MLMKDLHNSAYTAYLGTKKIIKALQKRVGWPKLPESVRQFVGGCTICLQTKDIRLNILDCNFLFIRKQVLV